MRGVAVVGAFATPAVEAQRDLSVQDLAFEGVRGVLADAGIDRADVDDVVICAHDLVDGRGIADMASAGAAGAYMKGETRTPNDGVFALAIGCAAVLGALADVVLVIGWAKSSEGFDDGVTATEFEPFVQRPVGLTSARALGLQATTLLQRDGDRARAAATAAVVRDRAHGATNPAAHLQHAVEAEAVESSDIVAWPLRELDLPPRSDGACGLVLMSAKRAAAAATRPVWITGLGWSSDGSDVGGRPLDRSPSLERAAQASDVDVRGSSFVEYAAHSSFQHIIVVEALGLCGSGDGASYLAADGEGTPVLNPSGGLASSNLQGAAGLTATVAAVERLRRADQESMTGVVHGTSGVCGQSNAVACLALEERGN